MINELHLRPNGNMQTKILPFVFTQHKCFFEDLQNGISNMLWIRWDQNILIHRDTYADAISQFVELLLRLLPCESRFSTCNSNFIEIFTIPGICSWNQISIRGYFDRPWKLFSKSLKSRTNLAVVVFSAFSCLSISVMSFFVDLLVSTTSFDPHMPHAWLIDSCAWNTLDG